MAENKITVLAPGTTVKPKGSDLKARVTDVKISANNKVKYKIAYWDNYVRKTEWLEEFEITLLEQKDSKKIVGFKYEQSK